MEALERSAAVRIGVRLEVLTVAWMVAEAALAIGAGIAARSVLLTAFGFDSVIELLSGVTLLWRLTSEQKATSSRGLERVERQATWISAVLLALLCAYVLLLGAAGLIARLEPERSGLGVAVSAVAAVVMPILAWRKRVANRTIRSRALRADSAETLTCAYMAAATLVGAALNLVLGWWSAEYLAAFVLLIFLIREAKEAFESAREHEAGHEAEA
jgi:divalent metal cation (Fe/Co/Zn/Cd) transporter